MNCKASFLKLWAWVVLMGLNAACVDPFDPKTNDAPTNYLVVDGFINPRGVSRIRLSRTLQLKQTTAAPLERQAQVWVEQEGGTRYACPESRVAGTYASDSIDLDISRRYRLYIRTANGREYRSAFVESKITPELDELNWRFGNESVDVFLNTDDPTGKTRYYRWDYDETWEYRSAYQSFFEYSGSILLPRVQDIHHCWGSASSPTINLANTARQTQDVISEYPLMRIPRGDVRLRFRYSILVKQYAQTQAEYEYWEMLRKNTQTVGSLFDPQPSQLTGNVTSLTDADERVIGYVGSYSVAQKRIFISRDQMPVTWAFLTGNEGCRPEPFMVRIADVAAFRTSPYLPVGATYNDAGVILSYLYSEAPCVDCRSRGGTVLRPSFW